MPAENRLIFPFKSRSIAVFLVFALGIVIPAGFLSYLGFRSYQYENLLLQRELAERYVSLADASERRLNEILREPLIELSRLAREPSVARGEGPDRLERLLAVTRLGSLPVEALFAFDADDHLLFPTPIPKPLQALEEPAWGLYEDEIRRLENLEYAQKRPREALAGYSALLRKPLDGSQRLALLNSVGGAAARLGDIKTSETAYLKIIREFDAFRDPSGPPAGFLARKLLADLYTGAGQAERAASIQMDLRRCRVLGCWGNAALPPLDDSLTPRASRAQKAEWARWQEIASRLRSLRSSGEAFVGRDWPGDRRRLLSRGFTEKGGLLQLGSAGASWLVAAPVPSGSTDGRSGLLIAVIPSGALIERMQTALSDLVRPAGLVYRLSKAKPEAPSGLRRVVLRAVGEIDPPIDLAFYQPLSLAENRVFQKRRWIYGGMVGLSLLVILVGLGLMGQAVRREAEMAELKASFVANVSHELRTPLSAIRYIAERLDRGRYHSEDEAKRFYGMLSEESDRLQELIEDVLDFSKALGGKKTYQLESADLRTLAEEAVDRLTGKARAGGFELSLESAPDPLPLKADARAVVHAIANLIDNALKYSGESRRVIVRLGASGERVWVEVVDFGIGIRPEERGRIFEKFYQGERNASGGGGGVGLGLALVQHVAQGHAAQVRVESEVGKGSAFRLEFPRESAEEDVA